MVKFQRAAFVPWSDEEDNALRTFYRLHGPEWEGWAEVLPDRTNRAIQARAQRIGAAPPRKSARPRPKRPKRPKREATPVYLPDPNERFVLKRMGDGRTPSEIDAERHWVPGTTVRILTERWERESERD